MIAPEGAPTIFLSGEAAILQEVRNLIGGFIAAFIFAQFISVGGFFFQIEWGYVMAFAFFIMMMFARPQGLFGTRG